MSVRAPLRALQGKQQVSSDDERENGSEAQKVVPGVSVAKAPPSRAPPPPPTHTHTCDPEEDDPIILQALDTQVAHLLISHGPVGQFLREGIRAEWGEGGKEGGGRGQREVGGIRDGRGGQ